MNFTGYCNELYPNSKTKWIKEFQDGQAVGIWMNFDEKGNLLKQLNTSLKLDSLNKIYEETFHVDLKDTTIYSFVEEEAKFRGDLNSFIFANLIAPKEVEEISFFPRIYMTFVVEKNGDITNVSSINKSNECYECQKALEQVFSKMPAWKPAVNAGKNVRSRINLPITIHLN
jgi:hypothetical protein